MLRMFRLEYFFHLQTVLQPMWRLLELSDCKCVRIPPKFVNLGSVLQLLQLQWSKQCPPGQQRYRWDREVVAEPTPLQRIGPQRGECHPGPRSGEMIIFLSNCLMRGCGSRNGVNRVDFLLCSGVVEHLLCETGHGFLSARFQSTCMVPFTVGAASSRAVVVMWIMQRACQESDPRPRSPAYMLPSWHTPVALWHSVCWNCASNLRNSASRNHKIQKSDSSCSGRNRKTKELLSARVAHLAPTGRSVRQ